MIYKNIKKEQGMENTRGKHFFFFSLKQMIDYCFELLVYSILGTQSRADECIWHVHTVILGEGGSISKE